MFEHSNMVDQENINPISGMVATRHRPQHSKPMIFEDQASSKEGGMMPSSDRGFVRQPLRDVTELFSTQLEKGGGAGAFDVAPSWQEETKAAHQLFKLPECGQQLYELSMCGLKPYEMSMGGLQLFLLSVCGLMPYELSVCGLELYELSMGGPQPFYLSVCGLQPYELSMCGLMPYELSVRGLQPYQLSKGGLQLF
eukprot:gene30012-18087_t